MTMISSKLFWISLILTSISLRGQEAEAKSLGKNDFHFLIIW